MTVDAARRSFRLPDLAIAHVRPLARSLTAGLFVLVAACSGSSNSTHSGSTSQTYTIGGTISGLGSASGLVLANGSTTLSVAASSSTFTFPAVPSGTTYAVSVQTSPTGLTCSVGGGSDTVHTANVTSIAVTCSTSGYTIGGSVTGLSASGLVLANGTDTYAVPAGASSYTLPTLVAPTSTYTVAVQAEPAGLNCSVVNGGPTTMPAQAVSNANVSCTAQPFVLGGTITGLNGSGLVLTNGTETLSVPANAANFHFATGVPFDAPYAVGIQTMATGLTCSVSNGSAAHMPASNVSSVVVTCSDLAFHLGGTISGLTSAGLVLSNGSDTYSVPANAPSFTMPTAVAYTSHYDVQIQSQPTGLSCSMSSNSAYMPASDVTTVGVTCATATYSIGGTISGLHGSGLVLANGGDLRTVPSNATSFTMPSSVAYGGSYTIGVHTQPRGYNCVVGGDSTSNNVTAAVTTVTVTCSQNPTWAYSPDSANSVILQYAVNTTTHALSLSGTTYPTDSGPIFVAVNAANTQLYVVNSGSNDITVYDIDPTTGTLTLSDTTPTSGFTPVQIVFNAAGTLAFVPNSGNDKISVFTVNSGSGHLTPITGSPFIETTTATPSPPATAAPFAIALHPTLPLLYVANKSSVEITTFSIANDGTLTQGAAVPAGAQPNGLVIDPAGAYAYVSDRYYFNGSVLEYGIDGSGALTLATSIQTIGPQPQAIAMDPTGSYVYTANAFAPSTGVDEFMINAQHQLVSIGSAATAAGSSSVTIDPLSGLLYVTNSGDATASISAFSITSGSGVLSAPTNFAGPTGSSQNSIVFATP
jgi:6-phosphogluconolactonase (cycloisomerase 2 family)